MTTVSPEAAAPTVEYVEVTTPRVHNLHHVEIFTPRMEESLDFFTRVLGLHETHREGPSAYLRAHGEFGHHSTILTERAEPGLGHMGWQVAEPDQVEGWARRLQRGGVAFTRVPGGTEPGQGDAVRFTAPSGHAIELFYEAKDPNIDPALKLKLIGLASKVGDNARKGIATCAACFGTRS